MLLGLMTPFHLGVSQQLQTLGVIRDSCALSGASGGALAAVFSAMPQDLIQQQKFTPLESTLYVAQQCRELGTRGTLGTALNTVLQQSLPDNAHEILNKRTAECRVAYTEVTFGGMKPQLVSQFNSKEDLIDCLRASCNIPFYLNGTFTVPVRGSKAIDGVFATDFSRFGCPFTGATDTEVIVTPFKTKAIGLNPMKVHPKGSNLVYEVISPDLLDRKSWPFRSREVLYMALTTPASSRNPKIPISDDELLEKYQTIFNGGIEATNRWYEKSRLNQK
eukprot:gene5543-5959_t